MSDEKQQALFEAWADHAFGPSTKLPQTERFTSYWKCWQAALAPQPKPAPVLLTDEEIDQPFIERNRRKFIDRAVARAIESAVLRKNGWGV